MPALTMGEIAPAFAAPTRGNPKFHFSTVPGRHVLLGFMPSDPARRDAGLAALAGIRFDGRHLAAFYVTAQTPDAAPPDRLYGERWFFDPDGAVGAAYGAGPEAPAWFVLDPALRIIARFGFEDTAALTDLLARLPPVERYAGPPMVAPVLIVPRVFDPAFCQRLIATYEAEGGQASGVMRDIGGKTVGVMDDMKKRRDVMLADLELRGEVLNRLSGNLIPMIARGLQFQATRLERYLVACYDADDGGYFRPHRDNETLGTAHRRFAVSINLNADEFEGGDLRFPEFGPRTYRPPTGGAVVFCCSLQHEATPVTRGRRYAFLPFLYDEAGQAIRDRNGGFLDDGPALHLASR
ncbi:MAG: 2OG-Fe(II) oxygenase [Caulobacterales bacterium]|nr:2OG-Fe(II) oxygenase [Caulobacterales bacterium]